MADRTIKLFPGPVVGECRGCDHSIVRYLCTVCSRYPWPSAFTVHEGSILCPSATQYKTVEKKVKVRVGQQKQKRKNR